MRIIGLLGKLLRYLLLGIGYALGWIVVGAIIVGLVFVFVFLPAGLFGGDGHDPEQTPPSRTACGETAAGYECVEYQP